GVLLLGRLVTGAGAGLLVPAVAGAVVGQDGGGRAVTAGVLGGAGVGAVVSGVLAEAGVARGVVLALGVLAVGWAVTRLLTLRLAMVRTAATPPTSGSGPSWRVATLVVFTANGLLALASSTVPGVVVDAVGGGSLVAGLTTGVVLLAAGAARLLVPTTSPLARPGPALAAAALAAVLLGAGLSGVVAGPVGATVVLGGGAILGGLCGLAYDRALASASPVGRTLTAAQLGLVLPVLLWPLVVR
ncbi:MAG: hypothetical protein HGA44_19760, partial [Cellulomonadaceae bacterium]|nr:hypothetical protein [Cellulomonadaceae bacterium]